MARREIKNASGDSAKFAYDDTGHYVRVDDMDKSQNPNLGDPHLRIYEKKTSNYNAIHSRIDSHGGKLLLNFGGDSTNQANQVHVGNGLDDGDEYGEIICWQCTELSDESIKSLERNDPFPYDLDFIKALTPYRYTRLPPKGRGNHPDTNRYVGLNASQVERAAIDARKRHGLETKPDVMVEKRSVSGNLRSYSYGGMIAALVKSVQKLDEEMHKLTSSQHTRVAYLEEQLANRELDTIKLGARVEELEKKLASLA